MKLILDASLNEDYKKNNPNAFKSEDDDDSSPRRKRELREVYIPPDELKKMREIYSKVVVQDFDDEYHMSKEERTRMQEQYEKIFTLKKGFTKKIRRLDKFVEAYRLCIQIVNELAESNGIYDPDTFRKMAFSGEIEIGGVTFPKFQGKRKKHINWKYVAECIIDPSKNVMDLINWDQEERDSSMVHVEPLSDDEMKRIMAPYTEEDKKHQFLNIFEDISKDGIATRVTKKDRKKLIKLFPNYIGQLKNMRGRNNVSERKKSHVWQMEQDQLDFIREYDAKYRNGKEQGEPVFDGNVLSNESVRAFVYRMEEYERETTLVEYNGRYITQEELEDLRIKEMLESNGYNLRNLYDNKEQEKRNRKASENDRKRIKRLRKMLAEIQERKEERESGVGGSTGVNKKKRKHKKGKKGKKMSRKMDKVILDAVSPEDENMKMYKKRMETMEWGGGGKL